ncbi:BZ3501_MvSof-1269-A2-R1_Chr12-3g03636 [Microbotryum saponariae]|nr:BZ3501_MvSof-1269-A2-R1_Chr12-3g03636 [Microbotryum saponariae]
MPVRFCTLFVSLERQCSLPLHSRNFSTLSVPAMTTASTSTNDHAATAPQLPPMQLSGALDTTACIALHSLTPTSNTTRQKPFKPNCAAFDHTSTKPVRFACWDAQIIASIHNAASKWCIYKSRARVYPRTLTHLPPEVRCKVHLQMVHSSRKLVRLPIKDGIYQRDQQSGHARDRRLKIRTGGVKGG